MRAAMWFAPNVVATSIRRTIPAQRESAREDEATKLGERLGIDDADRLAGEPGLDVLDAIAPEARVHLLGDVAEVRQKRHVGHFPQRMLRRQRLAVEHVER